MAKKEISDSELLANVLVAGLQEKKGDNILVIDMRELPSSFTEFMVLCSAGNYRQMEALLDSAEEFARNQLSEKPYFREGMGQESEWVLLDYVSVVLHVFKEDKRAFYALEDLWGDAKIKKF